MVQLRCPGCPERDERIAQLEATVRELNTRLGINATNSGTPPSANPPDAPKPVIKTPTGIKPGGQPGHPPRLKRRLPPERLHQNPEPSWHQVAELPPVEAQVREYQDRMPLRPFASPRQKRRP
ncbi:MAG: DUF6444 domain-containing protein [Gemmataceae bacterium]